FDVMGGWRDRYRAISPDVPPANGLGKSGWPFEFHHARPVDPSGELADGQKFKDVRELKRLLLEDETAIARNFVKQLAMYATGAPVRFSDREPIEKVLANTRDSEFGVRSIVMEVVQSELFGNK